MNIRDFCQVICLISTAAACKDRQEESKVHQIFYDAKDGERGDVSQRQAAKSGEFPFAISVGNKCAGFLISPEFDIAMTANHCQIKVNDPVCYADDALKDTICANPGLVSEILESSKSYLYDYSIIKISWVDPLPNNARHLQLEAFDTISALKKGLGQLKLVGYPADKYAKGLLTVSHCQVRAGVNEARHLKQDIRNAQLLNQWQAETIYYQDPEYDLMREKCYTFNKERRTFRADCSVYGGNSGGPLIDANSGRAIGLPATYYPEKALQSQCYKAYWQKFFWPIWYPNDATGQFKSPPEPKNSWADKWDNLDRETSAIEDIPEFIPIFEIVQTSEYLRANAEKFDLSPTKEN
jgi:V8-like Glu-specific endopeptidase